MIESALWFDDIGVVPGLLLFLWAVQRLHMHAFRKNRAGSSLGTRLFLLLSRGDIELLTNPNEGTQCP